MPIEIRTLHVGDESRLDSVASDLFDHAIDRDALREFLSSDRHHLVVAIDEGTVVAFASGVHYVHPDKPRPELFLNEVAVAPTHRRRGLGRRVLGALLDHGREIGCGEAWMLVDRANEAARRLYEACGVREADERQVMYSFDLGTATNVAHSPDLEGAPEVLRPPRPSAQAQDDEPLRSHTITVRSVIPDDADAWLRMRCALYDDAEEAELRQEIEDFIAGRAEEPKAVLIAEDDESRKVGLAELSIRPCAEGCTTNRVAYLEGWYVDPDARGMGVGGLLVKGAEEWGRSQGCTELASDTQIDNEASVAAHKALGFEDAGVIRCFRKEL